MQRVFRNNCMISFLKNYPFDAMSLAGFGFRAIRDKRFGEAGPMHCSWKISQVIIAGSTRLGPAHTAEYV